MIMYSLLNTLVTNSSTNSVFNVEHKYYGQIQCTIKTYTTFTYDHMYNIYVNM